MLSSLKSRLGSKSQQQQQQHHSSSSSTTTTTRGSSHTNDDDLYNLPPKKIVKAIKPYYAQRAHELSFSTGDFFFVINEFDAMFEVVNPAARQRGLVPSSYFIPLDKLQLQQQQQQQEGVKRDSAFDSESRSSQHSSSSEGKLKGILAAVLLEIELTPPPPYHQAQTILTLLNWNLSMNTHSQNLNHEPPPVLLSSNNIVTSRQCTAGPFLLHHHRKCNMMMKTFPLLSCIKQATITTRYTTAVVHLLISFPCLSKLQRSRKMVSTGLLSRWCAKITLVSYSCDGTMISGSYMFLY